MSFRRAWVAAGARHRPLPLALLPAAVAAAAIVAAALSVAGSQHRPSSRASGAVPSGFSPTAFTATGELTWWLLGTSPCTSPPCTSIVRTENGGRTFVRIPAPRTDRVSELRFADAQNGFAYGPQLWLTHDAGANWQQLDLGAPVTEMQAGAGYVYALVQGSGGAARLERAALGSDSFSPLASAGDAVSGLRVQGSDVIVESAGSPTAQKLLLSQNSGVSFAAHQVPPSVACEFAGMLPVVWAKCATGMLSGVWRSTDAGVSFAAAAGPGAAGAGGAGLPPQPNAAPFAAASGSIAVDGYRQLYRTTDGGTSWAPVATPSSVNSWRYLGFIDSTHGVALAQAGSGPGAAERLFYTADGGASYRPVPLASG